MKLQNFNSREELWGPVLDGVRVQLVSITRVGEDLYHRIMMEWFRNCILFNYVPTCGFFVVRLFHLEKLFMVNLIIGLLSTFSPRHSFTLFGQPRRANILCPNQTSIHPSIVLNSTTFWSLFGVLSRLFDGSSEGMIYESNDATVHIPSDGHRCRSLREIINQFA